MKSAKLSKIVAAAVVATTVATTLPTSAFAAWKQDSNGWWNTKGSSYSVGWERIDNAWYHFKNTGYMSTGWVNDKGNWYYLAKSGAMQTGWLYDNGAWYYLSKNSGAMQKGWIKLADTWYHLGQSGAMNIGFFNDATGQKYFADASGAMKTLWIDYAGKKYFADATGAIQTDGVIKIGDKIYYFDATGAIQTGKVTIDNVEYEFATTGEAIGSKLPTPKKAYTIFGILVDLEEEEVDHTSIGKSSSGGGGGSSSGYYAKPNTIVPQNIKDEYLSLTKMKTLVKNADGSYTVEFVSSIKDFSNTEDIVSRDLFVTNRLGTLLGVEVTEEDGKYTLKNTKGYGLKVRVVTRVVQDGVVYYLSSDEITLK